MAMSNADLQRHLASAIATNRVNSNLWKLSQKSNPNLKGNVKFISKPAAILEHGWRDGNAI